MPTRGLFVMFGAGLSPKKFPLGGVATEDPERVDIVRGVFRVPCGEDVRGRLVRHWQGSRRPPHILPEVLSTMKYFRRLREADAYEASLRTGGGPRL